MFINIIRKKYNAWPWGLEERNRCYFINLFCLGRIGIFPSRSQSMDFIDQENSPYPTGEGQPSQIAPCIFGNRSESEHKPCQPPPVGTPTIGER